MTRDELTARHALYYDTCYLDVIFASTPKESSQRAPQGFKHLAAVSSGPSAETANPPARPIAVKDALVAAVVAMAGVCGREWHTWSARRCGCLLATTKNLNSFGSFDCKAN